MLDKYASVWKEGGRVTAPPQHLGKAAKNLATMDFVCMKLIVNSPNESSNVYPSPVLCQMLFLGFEGEENEGFFS